jgi:hypothetical protein
MSSNGDDLRSKTRRNKRDKTTKATAAENDNGIAFGNGSKFERADGGGERFDENGLVERQIGRQHVEVARRNGKVLGKGAGVIDDAGNGAGEAVSGQAAPARGAKGVAAVGDAGVVDLGDDALAEQRLVGFAGHFGNDGAEFVAEGKRQRDRVIAAKDGDVGAANAGVGDAQSHLARLKRRKRFVAKLDVVWRSKNGGKRGGCHAVGFCFILKYGAFGVMA